MESELLDLAKDHEHERLEALKELRQSMAEARALRERLAKVHREVRAAIEAARELRRRLSF